MMPHGFVNTKDMKFALWAPLDAEKDREWPRSNILTSTALTDNRYTLSMACWGIARKTSVNHIGAASE